MEIKGRRREGEEEMGVFLPRCSLHLPLWKNYALSLLLGPPPACGLWVPPHSLYTQAVHPAVFITRLRNLVNENFFLSFFSC